MARGPGEKQETTAPDVHNSAIRDVFCPRTGNRRGSACAKSSSPDGCCGIICVSRGFRIVLHRHPEDFTDGSPNPRRAGFGSSRSVCLTSQEASSGGKRPHRTAYCGLEPSGIAGRQEQRLQLGSQDLPVGSPNIRTAVQIVRDSGNRGTPAWSPCSLAPFCFPASHRGRCRHTRTDEGKGVSSGRRRSNGRVRRARRSFPGARLQP